MNKYGGKGIPGKGGRGMKTQKVREQQIVGYRQDVGSSWGKWQRSLESWAETVSLGSLYAELSTGLDSLRVGSN